MKRMLQIGDTAPAIYTSDLWGNEISVPAKDKWIYVSFHRFAACPFCNLRTHELIRHYELFEKHNVEVISIWPSEKDSLLQHTAGEKSPFPMLSDKNKSIYKAYGVTESSLSGAVRLLLHPRLIFDALRKKGKTIEIDADPKLMPASFLIDPEGLVQLAYYGKHYGDHPTIESVLQHMKE